MRLFQFHNPMPIEALVLAADQDAATEIFEEHALARGGDPDTLLWRELSLEHLEDEARSAVVEAMKLGREGLVICESVNRWLFIAPLSAKAA